jgi:hypothetical protein
MSELPAITPERIRAVLDRVCKKCHGSEEAWTGQMLGGSDFMAVCECVRQKHRDEYEALDDNAQAMLRLAGEEPPR